MEEVESMWKKLSLSEEEEQGFEVPKSSGISSSLLAGKFLTHRSINKEAVIRTFRPLWRTRKPFRTHEMGDNKLVFEFENDVDLERVMEYEPWTFDKHLVLFQRIEDSTTISSLSFNECAFWIQIHNLPIKSMTSELGMSIGKSLGRVICVSETNEFASIGRSLRIRVAINVNKPLSRGRKLWENGVGVGWASFRYERLPNFCYWCGSLLHEDRECELWLSKRNKSSLEKGQFGPWMRAEMNPAGRKPWYSSSVPERGGVSPPNHSKAPPLLKSPTPLHSGSAVEVAPTETTCPKKANPVESPESSVHAKPLQNNPESFEKTLRLIDRELGLAADLVPPCEKHSEAVINAGKTSPVNSPAYEVAKLSPSACIVLESDCGPKQEDGPNNTFAFSAGCSRPPLQDISNTNGPNNKPKSSSQGTWTRLARQPTNNYLDENMGISNRVRPVSEDSEPHAKKLRASLPVVSNEAKSPLALAGAQPRQSP